MAGAGAKLFVDGTILDAVGINTYLMDQTIMRFATTTARDAAFGGAGEPVLAEGMFAYTNDTNTLWFYTGSAWEVATIKPSLVDAKGDLLAGTANDTVDRLAVGTNGQVLTANSSTSTGLAWAAAGKVLQVVEGTTSTEVTTTSLTFVTSGLSATITPSSTSSKVLVIANSVMGTTNNFSGVTSALFRGTVAGTNIAQMLSSTSGNFGVAQSMIKLDSPNTTSAQTYTMGICTGSGSNPVFANRFNSFSSMILVEIAA